MNTSVYKVTPRGYIVFAFYCGQKHWFTVYKSLTCDIYICSHTSEFIFDGTYIGSLWKYFGCIRGYAHRKRELSSGTTLKHLSQRSDRQDSRTLTQFGNLEKAVLKGPEISAWNSASCDAERTGISVRLLPNWLIPKVLNITWETSSSFIYNLYTKCEMS